MQITMELTRNERDIIMYQLMARKRFFEQELKEAETSTRMKECMDAIYALDKAINALLV